MTQLLPAQKASCADAFACPPGTRGKMSAVVPSETRFTWYNCSPYPPYNALTVLCAAMQGCPPDPNISQGPSPARAPSARHSAAAAFFILSTPLHSPLPLLQNQ
eukprot:Hpha_TRINITY_DN8881_c0_g1::TRINITY_DN8881_c0_g1_i1::g.141540::m.141540